MIHTSLRFLDIGFMEIFNGTAISLLWLALFSCIGMCMPFLNVAKVVD